MRLASRVSRVLRRAAPRFAPVLLTAARRVAANATAVAAAGQPRCFHAAASASTARANATTADGANTTHFGFQTVASKDKAKLVADVFHKVASRYDVMNDVMSGGMHRVWKEQFVAALAPAPGIRALDVAGGTGDISFRIVETLKQQLPAPALSAVRPQRASRVTVCDINASMLGVGRERALQRGYTIVNTTPDFAFVWDTTATVGAAAGAGAGAGADATATATAPAIAMSFVLGDAERLPFAADSFDAYTIAFGLRNVTRTDAALRDAHRVLSRGGRFMCLEFSHLTNPLLQNLYDAYSFALIPRMGAAIAGDAAPYQYLIESIRKFPTQPVLAEMMRNAGFRHVTYENYLGGVVSVHSGYKL